MSGRAETDLRRTAWRIGLQTAALLIGCLLVVGVVVVLAVVTSQREELNETLDQAVALSGTGGSDADHDGDADRLRMRLRGGTFTAVLRDGRLLTSGELPPGLPDEALMRRVDASGVADRREVHLSAGPYALLTARHDGAVVQAAVALEGQEQERERVLGALALAGGAGLVLATLAAVVLARRAVTPMAQALEAQRRFVADAGHELRTPLTLLSTRAQLLARRLSGGGDSSIERDRLVVRDVEGIVADTAGLGAILEELLVSADTRTPVPQEPVDIRPLMVTAVASAQAAATDAGISLTLRSTDDDTTIAAGAPTALGRALTALIDNALGHARSEVTVELHRTRRAVVVEVGDDGPGIADDVMPRLFTRFASGRSESGVAEPGARRHYGLGLALVNEIARRHGGLVTATNRLPPSSGAVLRLELPLH